MGNFCELIVELIVNIFDAIGTLILHLIPGNSHRDEEERHSCLGAFVCFIALCLIVGVALWCFVFRA